MATKLRASCDACHFAKIKCIKTEQGCQRCCTFGEQCSYSPALPRVYHRRRGRRLPSTTTLPVDESASRHATSVTTASHMALSAAQTLSPNNSNPAEVLSAENSAESSIHNHNWSANESNEFFWPFASEGPLATNYNSASDPLALDLWGQSATPPGLTSAVTPSSLTTATSPGSAIHQLLQSSPKQTQQGTFLNIQQSKTSNVLESKEENNYRSCRCFKGLLTATQRISEHANVSDPALDSVLCANRAAAKHCIASLQCPYGSSSPDNVSCTAVACGLLGHILASYQAALDSFRVDVEGKESENQNEHEDEEERAFSSGGLQVRLGAFTVDQSEQVLCVRDIVAREIEKLQLAVEGCTKQGEDVRSVLLGHLIKRCANLVDEITS